MEQLHHQAREALESSRYAYGWADFDKNPFGSVNVDLEFAGFVNGRIEEGEEALRTEVSRSQLKSSRGIGMDV